MKRNSLFLGLALVASIALVSCKSSESNYRKAYEKAKAEEQNRQETEPVAVTPVVTPVQTQPTQTVNQDVSNLRQEKLNVGGSESRHRHVPCHRIFFRRQKLCRDFTQRPPRQISRRMAALQDILKTSESQSERFTMAL